MGRLLSVELDLETERLVHDDYALDRDGDVRIRALLDKGFDIVWWQDAESIEVRMLTQLGAQVARVKPSGKGEFWYWSRAAWPDGYCRLALKPVIKIVGDLKETLFSNAALQVDITPDEGMPHRQAENRLERLTRLTGALSDQDLRALETVVRLGSARSVLTFLEAL